MSLAAMLIERRNTAAAEMRSILAVVEADDGRDLEEAEEANLTELRSTIETLDSRIETTQQLDLLSAPVEVPRPRRHTEMVEVRSEPAPYRGLGQQLRDLLGMTVPQQAEQSFDRVEAEERSRRHADWLIQEHGVDLERADVGLATLPGLVVPQYDETMVSRGIYDGAVSMGLMREIPLPTVGDSIGLPRVSTRATGAAIRKDNADTAEASFATALVTANIWEVSVDIPVSTRAINRGVMAEELIMSELLGGLNEEINEIVLMGNANASASTEPAGLLWLSTGRTVTAIVHTDGASTWTKINGYVRSDIAVLWKALRQIPDAIILSPKTWGGISSLDDTTGRPLMDLVGGGRNIIGVGQIVPTDQAIQPVGSLWGIPTYVDAAIPDTVKADETSFTGGKETRIVIARRSAMPLALGPVMSMSYEQTLAAKGQVLLIARREGAMNLGWRPQGIRVLTGTGLDVSGLSGDEAGLEVHPEQDLAKLRRAAERSAQKTAEETVEQ